VTVRGRRVRDFLSRNAIALASLSVAVMALAFTIYSASLDRQYKELAIQPALHWDVESDDFHVGIINNGVGPAEVQAVAFKFDGPPCLLFYQRPSRPDDGDKRMTDKVFPNLQKIGEYFGDPLNQLAEPSSIWEPKYSRIYLRTLTPGELIAANQEVKILEMQPSQLEIAKKRLSTLTADAYNNLIRRFFERANAIPYYVNYCSLTGLYCVKQIEYNCG
jgi:hypothetical protein